MTSKSSARSGRICANTIQDDGKAAMEPGMTTRELDLIGRRYLEVSWRPVGTGVLLQVSRRDLHFGQ
jgi:methionine aminopeptidase